MRILLIIAAVMSTSPFSIREALAENLTLLQVQYQPTQSSHGGRIEECSLRFTALASTTEGRMFGLAGTVGSTFWADRLPALVIKVSVGEVKKGDVTPIKVLSATMRVGTTDTRSMSVFPSPDSHSLLLYSDVVSQLELTATFPTLFSSGAWLSFSLDRKRSDYDVRLRPFGPEDGDTLEQYRQCYEIANQEYWQELDSQIQQGRKYNSSARASGAGRPRNYRPYSRACLMSAATR